ncbi:MAG: WXG100 family type VII secretion target [Nocardioides sp.]|uniref:WXG100 family type VII secretion target n=1 Tax=Nocardioides sp. TaxID=35761 RepID=UPI003F059EDB
MGQARHFTVDLSELDAVIGDLESTERALESLTDDLEKQVKALQSVWEGLAAEAQAEAHQTWEDGMRGMRRALASLRAASRDAHGNYTSAATSNVSMWEQFS